MILSFPRFTGVAALQVAVFALAFANDSRSVAADPPRNLPDRIDFNFHVREILSDRCFRCHGPDEAAREAGLRLDLKGPALDWTRKGRRAILPGEADRSELIRRIEATDESERMPPPESGLTLSGYQRAVLRKWIDQGADFQDHWSFSPIRRPRLPDWNGTVRDANAIDRFVGARLHREGLALAPQADPLILLRRVALDLTGLPPDPGQIDRFLSDPGPDAYERFVDEFLASPAYGEHMAASWLEAARYADTSGYQADWERFMWPWRDWVIRAYNNNMPFDQFTVEQVAGDLLPDASLDQIIASGFNRNHRINDEGGVIAAEYAVEYVVDRVDTTSTVWLGLTMGCARCHDHKYDPVSQKDFYRMFAFFNNVPEKGKDGRKGYAEPAVDYPDPDVAFRIERIDRRLAAMNAVGAGGVAPGPETESALDTIRELKKAREELLNRLHVKVMVMKEMDEPRETFLLKRGQYDQPDRQTPAAPGIPAVFGPMPDDLPVDRLGFARWLVHPDNPLTARVAVNRYWQRLFGRGLVKTPEDFGAQGARPTHPELLDWLADEFRRSGWDVKAMQKRIVMSAVYRQSSKVSAELLERDPENILLARGPRFRLSPFQLRDQALAMGGLLSRRVGGPSVKPYQPPGLWAEVSFQAKNRSTDFYVQDHGEKLFRRSLYTFWKRSVAPPQMVAFDAAGREACEVRSTRTSTPLQALTTLNDTTYVEAGRAMAERMMMEGGASVEDRLRHGLRLAATTAEPATLAVLHRGFDAYRAAFAADPAAAERLISTGDSAPDPTLDPVDLAAYSTIASLILNLDQTLTKE